jgi:hypothetical protein
LKLFRGWSFDKVFEADQVVMEALGHRAGAFRSGAGLVLHRQGDFCSATFYRVEGSFSGVVGPRDCAPLKAISFQLEIDLEDGFVFLSIVFLPPGREIINARPIK